MNKSLLRVAWDNSLAGRNRAGTGVYASGLLHELLLSKDLKIEIFEGWNRLTQRRRLLARPIQSFEGLLWTHFQFACLLRKGNFDVLHSPAFIAPLNSPCPTVLTVHDLTFRVFPEHFQGRWRWYLTWMMPSVLRAASAVICVSQQSKRDLLKYYEVSSNKVHVVHNGIDHGRFRPNAILDNDWASGIGIRGAFVLHVGTLSHRKNIPTLLRAIAHLRSKGKWKNWQLVLAGGEIPTLPGATAVYDTIQELGLGGIVSLIGHVPDQHLPGLYAHATALVMPSFYEGFGFPVLEGMACGTPVVASNVSSLPEIAGDAALLVPPTDADALAGAIEGVLEHRSLAEELRRKGLERARQFSWQRAATETAAIYRIAAKS